MKILRISYLPFVFAFLAFAACKKDDGDKLPDQEKRIVGSWTLSAQGYDNNEDGQILDDEVLDIPEDMNAVFTFNADHSGSVAGTTGVNGDLEGSFTWTLSSDNKLLLKSEEEEEEIALEVVNLNDSEFVLSILQSEYLIYMYLSRN